MSARVVALLGAECTGKTTLARSLFELLEREGLRVALVPEALREFCDRHARTPRADEQAPIAAAQAALIDAARPRNDVVIADTTALMTAVYSDLLFDDPSLYAVAVRAHAGAGLTLLCATDLPWVADGLQRDGVAMQQRVDARLRTVLAEAGLAYAVIRGRGTERLAAARAALDASARPVDGPAPSAWRYVCAECGDADCERHLFSTLRQFSVAVPGG